MLTRKTSFYISIHDLVKWQRVQFTYVAFERMRLTSLRHSFKFYCQCRLIPWGTVELWNCTLRKVVIRNDRSNNGRYYRDALMHRVEIVSRAECIIQATISANDPDISGAFQKKKTKNQYVQ